MCIFCKIVNKEIPSKVIYEDDTVMAILDLSQATLGHTLVLLKQHYENFLEVPKNDLEHYMSVTQDVAKHITKQLKAEGCNILTNVNEAAGQTIFHTHIHILPRYSNDDLQIHFTQHQINLDELLTKIEPL